MKKVFVDTSAYYALLNDTDPHHFKAKQYTKDLVANYITSQASLSELLTLGSQRVDREDTIAFVKKIIRSGTQIILESEELVQSTWDIFEKVIQKDVSWVDCYSVAIMKKYHIPEIFTFDKHFDKLVAEFL